MSLLKKIQDKLGDQIPYFVAFGLVSLFVVVFLWPRVFVTINSGEAGVLFKRFSIGTVTDYVYPEGFYVVNPFNTMFKYNVRHQVTKHTFKALTLQGLNIEMEVSIRYKPEFQMVGILHQTVGPKYIDVVVIPVVEASLRRVIGQYSAEELYTNKKAIIERIVNKSFSEVNQRFVEIDDVLIRKITLPDTVKKAIEGKLEQKHMVQTYDFILKKEKKEAERKRIEAKGIRDYQKTISETLTKDILTVKGILATQEIAKSENSKVIIIGAGDEGLPIILDGKN